MGFLKTKGYFMKVKTDCGNEMEDQVFKNCQNLFYKFFLLVFNLPTYRITPSAHPIKCPPQCLSPSPPHPLPTSPSTSPSSFPRVRSLSCSVSLSDISHSFFLLSPLFPFTIFYIPQMNETI